MSILHEHEMNLFPLKVPNQTIHTVPADVSPCVPSWCVTSVISDTKHSDSAHVCSAGWVCPPA